MPDRTLRFQHKLWQLVNNCRSGAVFWSHSGDSVIFNFPQFKKEYLDRNVNFCKSNKIASFVRQLNLYGFRKLMKSNPSRTDLHEFQNACFQRGRKDLLVNVIRSSTISADLKRSLKSTEGYAVKKGGRGGRRCQKRKISNHDGYEHRYGKQKRNKHYHNPQVKFQVCLSEECLKLSYQLKEYTRDPEDVENSVKEEIPTESFITGESISENYPLVPTTIKMTNFSSKAPEPDANVLKKKAGRLVPYESTPSDKLRKVCREFNGLYKKNEKNPVNLEQISCTTRSMLQDIPRFRESDLFPLTSNNGASINVKDLHTVLVPQKKIVPIIYNNASNIVTACVPNKKTNNQAGKQEKEILMLISESTQKFTDEQQTLEKWAYLEDDIPCQNITDDEDEFSIASNYETVERKNYFDLDELPEVTMRKSSYYQTDCEMTREFLELKSAHIRMKKRIIPSFCVCNSNITPSGVFQHL